MSMSRHSFQEHLVLATGPLARRQGIDQRTSVSSTGDPCWGPIPTKPMAHPVSSSSDRSPPTLAPLLTSSLLSPQTTLPLLPLHVTPGPLLHVTSPIRDGKPSPGTQVVGTALSVAPLNGGAGGAQGRRTSDWGPHPNLFPPPPPCPPPAGEPGSRRACAPCICCPLVVKWAQYWGTRQEGRRAHSRKHHLILSG